jgi:AcrR family transcriptional regulator
MRAQRPRQARSEVRRQQIVATALVCFTELGFSETTMEVIRRRSGASTGSIYNLFGSKEELAAAVYLEGLRHYQSGFVEALSKNRAAQAGVKAVVRYHLGWVEEHPDWAGYLFQMRRADFMAAATVDIKKLNQEFMKNVAAWFRPHINSGFIRRLPVDLYPALILGPCQEFAREWLAGSARTEIKTASRKIANAVWRAVAGSGKR